MAWYQNPTIAAVLGGIAGALLSVIVSVYIWRRTQKIKRIDCVITDVSSLLSVSEKIKDQLQVTYAGNAAEAVYLISIDVLNTGNEAVSSQPVRIRLPNGSQILDFSLKTEPPVGFGEIKETKKDANCLDLEVALMNKGDRASIDIVSIDNPSDEVGVYLKNENVQTRVYSRHSAETALLDVVSDRNMMFLAILSAIPFFGGLARSLINVGIAQRIGNVGAQPNKSLNKDAR